MCLGIPGQITEIVDIEKNLAKVNVSGVQREVNIACIVEDDQPVDNCIGEWVLVHVGFAMSRIDAEEAEKTLNLLTELGEAEEELRMMQESVA